MRRQHRRRGLAALAACTAFLLGGVAVAVASHSASEHWKKHDHDSRAHFKIVWLMQAGEWSVPDSAGDWNAGQSKLEFKQEREGSCDHNCLVQQQDEPGSYGFGSNCTGVLGATGLVTGADNHANYGVSFLNRSCVNSANDYKRHVIECHELGHMVRLHDRDGGSSCLRSPYEDIQSNTPDSHDKDAITNMYSHGT